MESWRSEYRKKIIETTLSLTVAENILSKNGFKYPKKPPRLYKKDKIRIPTGYIRTAKYFRDKYHLYKYITNKYLTDNIAYALQTTDLYNYLLNRFDIDLSVKSIFIKNAMINGFSIIEAIMTGVMDTLHYNCNQKNILCKNNSKCFYYVKNANVKFKEKVDCIQKKGLIELSNFEVDNLYKIKNKRDNIHIWLANKNEFTSDFYSIENYNQIPILLSKIRKSLPIKFDKFIEERSIKCKYKLTKY